MVRQKAHQPAQGTKVNSEIFTIIAFGFIMEFI